MCPGRLACSRMLGAPNRQVWNAREILVVRGDVSQVVGAHRGNDRRIVGEQVMASTKFDGVEDLAPFDRHHSNAELGDLRDEMSSHREVRHMLRMPAKQIQGVFRRTQTEAFDHFSQQQAVDDFTQDNRRCDRMEFTSPGSAEQRRAAWA